MNDKLHGRKTLGAYDIMVVSYGTFFCNENNRNILANSILWLCYDYEGK